jgi:flagellar motor switch protein FliN/FliY
MPEESEQPQIEQSFQRLLDVPLQISVEIGKTRMRIQELLDLGQGAVVTLDRLAGEPVDVLVNGRPVALGEIVVSNDRYAVRIVSIHSPADRVESLG